jgi:hypothetical protein
MNFKKYQHIEKYGNSEVQGIEFGKCYIFPKLDGTNASIWLDDNKLKAGSRTRELTFEKDNAKFYEWVMAQENIFNFFRKYKNLRLYGEWLVPHTLKTYRDNAWKKFYVFDVMVDTENSYLAYDDYKSMLSEFNIDYIPPLSIITNVSYENLLVEVSNNKYLISNGGGIGEGIIIKNYQFKNKYGYVVWAKIINNEFKDAHMKSQSQVKELGTILEQKICDEYITTHLIDKTFAKIVNEMEGWNSKYIPRLFGIVFHDLITEELWNVIKKMKNPTINFKTLNSLAIIKIKNLKPELF